MISDVLLYLSSAMAQVWAALMIFEAIKLREDRRDIQAELNRTFDIARSNLAHMILAIKCYESHDSLKKFIQGLPPLEWEKFRAELNKAMTNNNSLTIVLTYIKKHNLLSQMNGFSPDNQKLGLVSWNEAQSMCEDYLEQIETSTLYSFLEDDFNQTKFFACAILFNLFCLSALSFSDFFECDLVENGFLWTIFTMLVFGNISGLWHLLVKRIRKFEEIFS